MFGKLLSKPKLTLADTPKDRDTPRCASPETAARFSSRFDCETSSCSSAKALTKMTELLKHRQEQLVQAVTEQAQMRDEIRDLRFENAQLKALLTYRLRWGEDLPIRH